VTYTAWQGQLGNSGCRVKERNKGEKMLELT
jgi:hypothetical protein